MNPCPKCGYHNAEDAIRCINCGYEILHEAVPQAVTGPENIGQIENTQTQKRNKDLYRFVLLIILILLCVMAAVGLKKNGARSDAVRPSSANTVQAETTARAGGAIPTKIPTVTPTALTGMESPLFCKLEMAMIHDKVEKLGGSGMLIPDSYEQSSRTCSFMIRGGRLLSEIGTIRTVHTEGDDFGVRVEIRESTGIIKNEQMALWGAAALMALDKELSQTDAEALMKTVTEDGTAAWNNYDLTLKENALTKTDTLSIIDRTKSADQQ